MPQKTYSLLGRNAQFPFKRCVALILSFFWAIVSYQNNISEDEYNICNPIISETHNKLDHINKIFLNIDYLFRQTTIKVNKIDEDKNIINEFITTIEKFINQKLSVDNIIDRINNTLEGNLPNEGLQLLRENNSIHLKNALELLWKHNYLDEREALTIFNEFSPLSPLEIIKLIENGIVLTKSQFLVQLKTGQEFGNPLNLIEKINEIRNNSSHGEIRSAPIMELLSGPLRDEAIKAFNKLGLNGEALFFDAKVIFMLRQHFLFLSTLRFSTVFGPATLNTAPDANKNYTFDLIITPNHLSALLVGTFYFHGIDASLSQSVFANPLGITYSSFLSFDQYEGGWWLHYTDSHIGAGINYTAKFDQGSLWSNSNASYLSFGAFIGGWKNRLSAGISLHTLLSNNIGLGISPSISVSRNFDVSYLGEYPIDGKFAEIRGLNKIEIRDCHTIGYSATLSTNAASLPLGIAFQASKTHTKERIFRTHITLANAAHRIRNSDKSGLLFMAGKKIKNSGFPSFNDPTKLQVGDEFLEIKTGKLRGAFVIGLESLVPIHAFRIGGNVDLIGDFELGIRRLPNDKYEVSIEPKKVFEISFFSSLLNTIGVGKIKSIAIARKQIFSFDFKVEEAKRAYFELIHHGRLPSHQDLEISPEGRGPEHLLGEFRIQNEKMRERGVERIYLEKVKIKTKKIFAGINAPIISAFLDLAKKGYKKVHKKKKKLKISFEGIDREVLSAQAESVATNGIISVYRKTYGGRQSEGQGSSGRFNRDIFVTHKRIHSIDDSRTSLPINQWQFDSLTIHGQLEDTIITGNEENKMANKINKIFGTYIGSFELKNSKSPRTINIERELRRPDFLMLTSNEAFERIEYASQVTKIDHESIHELLKRLRGKHPDKQSLLVKNFIQTQKGLKGFAAIHQLLGANPSDIIIHSEGGYMQRVFEAKNFILSYQEQDLTTEKKLKLSLRNEKEVKRFFSKAIYYLNELDNQLKLLHDDRYLIDDRSPLYAVLGPEKTNELLKNKVRQDKSVPKSALISVRNSLFRLLDLERQGYDFQEQIELLKIAGWDRLNLNHRALLLYYKYAKNPINAKMSIRHLRKCFISVWKLLKKINKKIIELEEDEVIKKWDPKYIESRIKGLKKSRIMLEGIISIERLKKGEINCLINKLDNKKYKPKLFFSKKIRRNARIKAVLSLKNDGFKNENMREGAPN